MNGGKKVRFHDQHIENWHASEIQVLLIEKSFFKKYAAEKPSLKVHDQSKRTQKDAVLYCTSFIIT